MIIRLLLLGVTIFALWGFSAELTTEQAERVDFLQHRILSPCCWQEPVAEHRNAIAAEIRDEIEQMVAAGKTNREVLDHYKAEYGMRILVEPEGGLFVIMNAAPAVILVLGAIVVVLVLRKWLKSRPAEATEQSA